MKKVVRQYGDGPVAVPRGHVLEVRFKGRRGDLVGLGQAYRVHSDEPYYGTVSNRDVGVRGPGRTPELDASGYARLPANGWFTIRYQADYNQHLQLFKQVRLAHDDGSRTRLPRRRGYQYAVRVWAPRSGLQVVSFGAELYGVVSRGRYLANVDGESLVVSPGVPVSDGEGALSEKLVPGQQVVVMVDPSQSGVVSSTVPTDVGRVALDGPAVALPGGGDGAVVAEVETSDLAASAQRLLNVRLPGSQPKRDWKVIALSATGGLARPSAPAYSLGSPAPFFQVPEDAGTWRVLAFPTTADAVAGQFELDSVADGGAIVVDAPAVSVPIRPDGRYTLLTISQSVAHTASYLSVPTETVNGPWVVYAGRLSVPHCGPRDGSGCGEGIGVSLSSTGTDSLAQYGGYVLTMPTDAQTTGSFSVQLTTSAPD